MAAVVINDFEVVSESAPATRGVTADSVEGHGETGGGGSSAAPTPNDIRRVLRRQLERMERIRAD